MRMRMLVLGVVAGAVGACGRSVPPSTDPPRVTIVAPTDGAVLTPEVEVVLQADGVRIVAATGTREAGEAHHHLVLDADLPLDLGQPLARGEGITHLGAGDTTHRFSALAPGTHRLIAVLAWGDHVPVAGAVQDTVTFTVAGPGLSGQP